MLPTLPECSVPATCDTKGIDCVPKMKHSDTPRINRTLGALTKELHNNLPTRATIHDP